MALPAALSSLRRPRAGPLLCVERTSPVDMSSPSQCPFSHMMRKTTDDAGSVQDWHTKRPHFGKLRQGSVRPAAAGLARVTRGPAPVLTGQRPVRWRRPRGLWPSGPAG